jgi:hypothetical protein
MHNPAPPAETLPPVCYVSHPTTGETVEIRRGEAGYHPTGTPCSPACLNRRLRRPPTADEIAAMKHGSLIGWNTPGADPALWQRRREAEESR